jgi:aspartyl-tRNA(Asn)/glutamyl-tRNA(Gln) amidotransferase subunit A
MAIKELVEQIKTGKRTALSVVREALDKAEKYADYNAFVSLNRQGAEKTAEEIDRKIAKGESVGCLAGVPYALKDNFLSQDGCTTASSLMLESFASPVTATSVRKLEAEGAVVIGRTNLDSFAHGSSTETSYFGSTLNAHDKKRVAGGSSGGSAVAVALGIVPFATASDTGGSIRQPASFNGVYGMKPTYGTVSRSGVVAMASSTDTIGCMAATLADVDLIMSVMAGQDPLDSTTLPDFYSDEVNAVKTVGVIKDFNNDSVDPEIRRVLSNKLEELKAKGYKVKELSMPMLKYALAVYYVVTPAEVASNLSKYDGIRYGYRSEGAKSLSDIYVKSRNEGFVAENKRRIMIGNFVLSSGFYDAYYLKAQKARTLIIQEYAKAFEQVDVLLTPVSPSPAFKLGEKISDPVAMYMEDVMSVPINLAGLPAFAVPAGKLESGLPIGLQIIGPRRYDRALIKFAEEIT